jgi:hypothetical protein
MVTQSCKTNLGLSPWKQRAFAGALHGYLFNGYTRLAAQAPYFAIPIGTGKPLPLLRRTVYLMWVNSIRGVRMGEQKGCIFEQ